MKKIIGPIKAGEFKFIFLLVLLLVVITALPFLYGYFTKPADSVYTGLHHLAPGDTNVFLSMIEQVKQGNNVFINLYTAEPQARLLVNPLWLSVGWLAKLFNLPNLLALQIARSLWIIIFIVVLYLFIAYFFRDARTRKWVIALIVFSSGLGAFFNPFLFDVNNIYEHPTDIWVTESITFLTLLHSPHIIASLTLIILTFFLMLLAWETDKMRYSIGAGIASLFLLWFHPFNGPTVYVTLLVYITVLFFRQGKIVWSYVQHFFILGIIPLPVVLYLYLLTQTDWVIRNWAAQNILLSPSVWMYLIGYGFILILALLGLWISIKKPDKKRLFITVWALSSAFLIYAPVAFQRRMSEGWHIPLSILAFWGIAYLLKQIRSVNQRFALVFFLVIFLPLTNLQILGQDIYLYHTKKTLPYYLYQEEVAAMQWLRDKMAEDEVIFSSYYMGNYIPAYSGRKVWIGHGPQTINLPQKYEQSKWFWRDNSESDKKYLFLKAEDIDYLWYGRKEKELGSYQPASKKYLKKIFSNQQVAIYRVL